MQFCHWFHSITWLLVYTQTLSTMDRSCLLAHQAQSNFWSPSSTSQEVVSCSGVDSMVFSQKTDGYHRPTTSNQYTQHDALGAFRSKVSGFAKIPVRFLLHRSTSVLRFIFAFLGRRCFALGVFTSIWAFTLMTMWLCSAWTLIVGLVIPRRIFCCHD